MSDFEKIKDMDFCDALELFPKGIVIGLNPAECVLVAKALYSYLDKVKEESPTSAHSVNRAILRIVDFKMRPLRNIEEST